MYNTNQFMPYGRQPYYTPSYQPQPQQPMEMVFSDVRILTADQIKGFIPPINSKVLLIDKDNALAYVETTDTMGNMYKQAYAFSLAQTEKPKETPTQDFSNFATKKDIEQVVEQFRKEIDSLKNTHTTEEIKANA